MSRARRIALNTAWLAFSQLLPLAATVVVTGYVARVLGREGFGLVETAMAVATIASPIIFAGIQIILVREIVRDPERGPEAVGDALAIRLLLFPVYAAIVYFATPAVIPREIVLLAIGTQFLMMYMQSLTIPFEASERMHYIAIGALILYFVGLTLSALAAHHGFGPVGLAGARCAGQLAAFLYLTVAAPIVLYRPKLHVDLKRWLRILRMGVPLAIPYLLGLVLLELDKWMLVAILGPERGPASAGEYSAVTMLAYKFDTVVVALATAVTPALVSTFSSDREGYRKILGGALRVTLLVSLPVAIGTGFVARDVMDLIFGPQYVDSARSLSAIIWFVPLQFVNRIFAVSLAATDREKWVGLSMCGAVALNGGLNALMIPHMDYHGAALATVASEIGLTLMYLVIQRHDLLGVLRHMKLYRVLVAGGLLYGLCWLLSAQSWLVIVAAACVAYPVIVVATRGITRADLGALRGGGGG